MKKIMMLAVVSVMVMTGAVEAQAQSAKNVVQMMKLSNCFRLPEKYQMGCVLSAEALYQPEFTLDMMEMLIPKKGESICESTKEKELCVSLFESWLNLEAIAREGGEEREKIMRGNK